MITTLSILEPLKMFVQAESFNHYFYSNIIILLLLFFNLLFSFKKMLFHLSSRVESLIFSEKFKSFFALSFFNNCEYV